MQKNLPILQSAIAVAQSRFSELANTIVSEADSLIVEDLAVRGGRPLLAAHEFLRVDSAAFVHQLESLYCDYLNRARQTMYTDLRADLRSMSAEHLSLIDDETMNNQIEVDRLVQRLRDADSQALGRLNIMISQLNDEPEVRERENPFRPYLLARTLHDVLKVQVKDDAMRDILFEHVASAMVEALPAYYQAIRTVFEAAGIRAKLIARPSMMSAAQRDHLARQAMQKWQPAAAFPAGGSSLPSQFTGQQPAQTTSGAQGFPELLRQMFNLPKLSSTGRQVLPDQPAAAKPEFSLSPASESLIQKLHQFQQRAAQHELVEQTDDGRQNDLFSLRETLEEEISGPEQVTMEVVALLFEFILRDELIPEAAREKIARLQIPFLRAAMQSPDMLQQPDHPARLLLDRMGVLAAGLTPESPDDDQIQSEMARVTDKLLSGYDSDPEIFADCNRELEQFAVQSVPVATPNSEVQQALDEAETVSVLMTNISTMLETALRPMKLDVRLSEFILQTWARVLAHAAYAHIEKNEVGAIAATQLELIPGLIWSTQMRQTTEERAALMRFLPGLVTSLRKNLQATPLSEQEYQQALDQLLNLHADVLRPAKTGGDQPLLSVRQIDEQLSKLVIDTTMANVIAAETEVMNNGIVKAALAKRKLSADIFLDQQGLPPFSSEVQRVAQIKLSAQIDYTNNGSGVTAQLINTSRQLSLFAFSPLQTSSFLIFSCGALIKMMREGRLKIIETASLFERAVDSLMNEVDGS